MKLPKITLFGETFGKVLVLAYAGKKQYKSQRHSVWLCKCHCGKLSIRPKFNLNNVSKCSSCVRLVHGHRRQRGGLRSYTLNSWRMMKNRCNNSKAWNYKYYGGLGITYQTSWDKFENFLKDLGERPSKKFTLDRINPHKGYTKENCRWADSLTQARNKRTNFDGP